MTTDLLEPVTQQAPVTLRDEERQRCEVWTRVMGYHRPVASFNIGKQGEFNERRYFVEPGRAPALAPAAEAPMATLSAANSDSTLMNSHRASAPDFTISPRPSTMCVCGEIG